MFRHARPHPALRATFSQREKDRPPVFRKFRRGLCPPSPPLQFLTTILNLTSHIVDLTGTLLVLCSRPLNKKKFRNETASSLLGVGGIDEGKIYQAEIYKHQRKCVCRGPRFVVRCNDHLGAGNGPDQRLGEGP